MEFIGIIFFTLFSLNILGLFYFGAHSYLMLLLYRRGRENCISGREPHERKIDLNALSPQERAGLPFVTVQLPLYNEFYVIDRLLSAATALRWPRERLEIQILDDSQDETREKSARLTEYYREKGFHITRIHREDRKDHKAGALRTGLESARGELIAIFDADFVPDPDFLLSTAPYFSEKRVGMVQTRWGHLNEDYSPLTRAQSFAIDGHFTMEQVARSGNDLWMNFNGTGGIWRKEAILDAGNWSGDTLTEDFDLSYRAMLAGWKFRYFQDLMNPAEIPATVAAFKSQQFRWCKGSIQTAFKLIPAILKSKNPLRIKGEAITHLLNYSVHPLMILNIFFTLPLLLMDDWAGRGINDVSLEIIFTVSAFFGLASFGPTLFYVYTQKELYPNWTRRLIWLPMLMIIGVGIAASNTRAWLEAALGVRSGFKRTPKYGLRSRRDELQGKKKYRQKLDWIVLMELFMGVFCLINIYFSVVLDKLFVLPYMVLYASGFFYLSFKSISESLNRTGRMNVVPERNAA